MHTTQDYHLFELSRWSLFHADCITWNYHRTFEWWPTAFTWNDSQFGAQISKYHRATAISTSIILTSERTPEEQTLWLNTTIYDNRHNKVIASHRARTHLWRLIDGAQPFFRHFWRHGSESAWDCAHYFKMWRCLLLVNLLFVRKNRVWSIILLLVVREMCKRQSGIPVRTGISGPRCNNSHRLVILIERVRAHVNSHKNTLFEMHYASRWSIFFFVWGNMQPKR